MVDKKDILLLFDYPLDPVFFAKGESEQRKVFDIPQGYIDDLYPATSVNVAKAPYLGIGKAPNSVPVHGIPLHQLPNFDYAMQLDRHAQFSLFIPKHRDIAGSLIDIFMGAKSYEDLKSLAVYSRDRLNPYLFNYAFSVAILHHPDTKGLTLPLIVESFPDKFVDSRVFAKIRDELNINRSGTRKTICVPKDYTASDLEDEHRLWYFREDLGVNLHHWHWHLVYPHDVRDPKNEFLVNKDRRGELFYFMHQQIVARYNFERFSNKLARVKRLNNLRESIPEAYFPKMNSNVASRSWPARVANTTLKDVDRQIDGLQSDVADLERWKSRLFEAIHQGYIEDSDKKRIILDEKTGIDILGNLIESSNLSKNRQFYGDLHNMGHVFISVIHDPDYRNLELLGVMGDNATAMRDPIFYRWHAYLNDVFEEFKESLSPYTTDKLNYPGIEVTKVDIQPVIGRAGTFETFWQKSDVDFTRGLDLKEPPMDVLVRFTHLQHQEFTYVIKVNNTTGGEVKGTCRIFLAPKFDESGKEMAFKDQRLLMTEMDKFVVTLKKGENSIPRKSTESTVTIPFDRTFRNLDKNRPPPETPEADKFNYCGCGWPQHMLVPKGKPEGMKCQLFVMISNYKDDEIVQEVGKCGSGTVFCGVRDRLYPDLRAMGYPFDRLAPSSIDTMSKFLTPNMHLSECSIFHTDNMEEIGLCE